MDSFGKRIEAALDNRGKTKIWLADQIGLSKQALNYIINQASKPGYVNEIALALNIDTKWLETGDGELEFFDELGAGKKIPIFNAMNFFTKSTLNDQDKYLTIDSLETDDTFAYILENKSMEPLFAINTILILRENKVPCDGDFILCTLDTNNEIIFRQYFKDGSGTYLKAINQVYRDISGESYKILGTLIESRFRYYK